MQAHTLLFAIFRTLDVLFCVFSPLFLPSSHAVSARAGSDLGLADTALWEASECFERCVELDPSNIKALGNWGNALYNHGRLKRRMLEAVSVQGGVGGGW